jgi:hypothetical protein
MPDPLVTSLCRVCNASFLRSNSRQIEQPQTKKKQKTKKNKKQKTKQKNKKKNNKQKKKQNSTTVHCKARV